MLHIFTGKNNQNGHHFKHFQMFFLEWNVLYHDLKIHWVLFLKVKLAISWHRCWLGTKQATSHYLSQLQPVAWHHISLLPVGFNVLTHWGWDKMGAMFQTTMSNAFSYMKMYKFWLRFHWILFPMKNFPALVQMMAWHWPGDKPLSEPMMVSKFTDGYMHHSASKS